MTIILNISSPKKIMTHTMKNMRLSSFFDDIEKMQSTHAIDVTFGNVELFNVEFAHNHVFDQFDKNEGLFA